MTGGNGNGIYYGAQIDLVGSIFKQGADLSGDDGSGTVQISAGYRKLTSPNWYDGPLDGAIIFRTLREENDQDDETDVSKAAHSGAQRFRIELDGTVRVVYTGDASLSTDYGKVHRNDVARNLNPGRFIVEGQTSAKNVTIKNGQISVGTNEIVNASGVVTITGGIIDSTTTIGGRAASVIAGAINSNGNFTNDIINARFDTANTDILAEFSFGASGALQIGSYVNGTSGDIRISPSGITARNSSGNTTFTLSGTTGAATFGGQLSAPTGDIGGWTINPSSITVGLS